MAWTGISRQEHSRKGLRYSSDMTDREWELAVPFIPPAKRGGRRRCAWRLLPKCFPPVSTVQRYFYAWRNTGLLDAMNTVLVMNLREIEGREASPICLPFQCDGEQTRPNSRSASWKFPLAVTGNVAPAQATMTELCVSAARIIRPIREIRAFSRSNREFKAEIGSLRTAPRTRQFRNSTDFCLRAPALREAALFRPAPARSPLHADCR